MTNNLRLDICPCCDGHAPIGQPIDHLPGCALAEANDRLRFAADSIKEDIRAAIAALDRALVRAAADPAAHDETEHPMSDHLSLDRCSYCGGAAPSGWPISHDPACPMTVLNSARRRDAEATIRRLLEAGDALLEAARHAPGGWGHVIDDWRHAASDARETL